MRFAEGRIPALIAGTLAAAVWWAGETSAQDSGAFCGQSGPMIVSTRPLDEGIDGLRLMLAGGDEEAHALLQARGHENTAVSPEGDLAVFVVNLRHPALLSSAEIANRAFSKIGCDKLVVVPFE